MGLGLHFCPETKSLTFALKASARHGRRANSQRHQRRTPL
ncbi:hypothetical protein THIOKS11210008 [Thiocapsa sp. KS1]|nr:hypothetical protein THIOKS11210008 [Thiocapsa sp. KS1]